jgi:hypothetical protein
MHCHSCALETDKYLSHLENMQIVYSTVQFVFVIYTLRTGYLHIVCSFFYCYLHFTFMLLSLFCTVL